MILNSSALTSRMDFVEGPTITDRVAQPLNNANIKGINLRFMARVE